MTISQEIHNLYKDKLFIENIENKIRIRYKEYVTKISDPLNACSFETYVFLYNISKLLKPKKILDLGSGFSSLTFRAANDSKETEIYSIDTLEFWLNKSKEYCKSFVDINHDNFLMMSKIDYNLNYDLVFVDIDKTINRLNYIEPFINKLHRKNNYFIFDDMHKQRLSDVLDKTLKNYEFEEINIKQYMLENKGKRFCRMIYNLIKKKRI